MRPVVKLNPPHACTFKLWIDRSIRNQEKKRKRTKKSIEAGRSCNPIYFTGEPGCVWGVSIIDIKFPFRA
jgi:hypothetical protein